MNITGIIAEYNPLHKGHVYHIKKSKKITNADGIVVIMSGNFVQRGFPAIIDKWNRTKMALLNGVDLVIELPTLYSVSSAEFFAQGAISILNSFKIINNLCFGSEYSNISFLYKIAKILTQEPIEYKNNLKYYLNKGISYPLARNNSLKNFLLKNYPTLDINELNNILNSSNNILGIEYCKSLIKLKSHIKPFCIKRKGSNYNDLKLNNEISSASSIRKFIKENKNLDKLKNYLPENIFNIVYNLNESNYPFVFEDSIIPYLKYKSYNYKDSIKNLPDVSEGIDNRIFKYLDEHLNYENLIKTIKTKRYTYTRISRILCQFFLGFDLLNTKILRKNPCPYIRILGLNNTGSKILKKIKNNNSIPIYTKLPKNPNEVLKMDIQATKMYSLINKNISPKDDYLKSPIILEKL